VSGLGNGTRVKVISHTPPDPEVDPYPQVIADQTVPYEQWLMAPELLERGLRCLLLEKGDTSLQEMKSRLLHFCSRNLTAPIIYKTSIETDDPQTFQLQLAGELGLMLIDGAIDAIWVSHPPMDQKMVNASLLTMLQAVGARISKTEFIACPSCGRTHFDILTRLREIREATSHLTSLKIGVMGCIVNGPGEMADADYGYVGAGPGRITLYRRKEAVLKNIPEQEALQKLMELIKKEGDWIDP
jgi:hypothetical protein